MRAAELTANILVTEAALHVRPWDAHVTVQESAVLWPQYQPEGTWERATGNMGMGGYLSVGWLVGWLVG